MSRKTKRPERKTSGLRRQARATPHPPPRATVLQQLRQELQELPPAEPNELWITQPAGGAAQPAVPQQPPPGGWRDDEWPEEELRQRLSGEDPQC